MNYIRDNLFTSTDNLCHCVSADLYMGAGIAKIFKEKFGNVENLRNQKPKIGSVLILEEMIDNRPRFIFYLVTKNRYRDLPTLEAMELVLCNLNKQMNLLKLSSISMPKIGCGLDKLKWKDVEQLINKHLSKKYITVYFI